MDGTIVAALVQGLALGGVLAVAGSWSRSARAGPLPHLGVGALSAVAVVVGARLSALPWGVTVVLVLGVGAGLGRLAWLLDQRVRAAPEHPAAVADLTVLAAAVAVVGLLVPLSAAPFGSPPLGAGALATGASPVGGTTGLVGALLALAAGVGTAAVVVLPLGERIVPGGLSPARTWTLAGAGLALSTVLAGGVLAAGADARPALLASADPVGLALRAAAAALAARGDPSRAAAAGVALGVAESLTRLIDPTGAIILLPAVGVAVLSVLRGWPGPSAEPTPAAEG